MTLVKWNPSHESLHDNCGINEMINDIIEVRMRHFYELFLMKYNPDISKEEYFSIFKEKFIKRKDYIHHFRFEVNIWNEFGNGKVSVLTDNIIKEWVDKWIDSKTMSEEDWYKKSLEYKEFYFKKYKLFFEKVITFAENGNPTPYYEWFLNTHLLGEVFPYHYPDE